jgi:hypothetical protein
LTVQEAALSYFQQNGFTIVRVMEPDLMANDASRIAVSGFRRSLLRHGSHAFGRQRLDVKIAAALSGLAGPDAAGRHQRSDEFLEHQSAPALR